MAAFEFKSDEEKYQADQTVQFKIERDEVTSTCGLEIKYGDGYSKIFKFEAGKKTMIETYVYKNPGRYKVDLDGKTIFRGLGTTFSCVGPIQNRIVSVEPSVPSAAIAAKMVTAPSAVPTPVIAPTPAVVATTTASNEAAQVFAHRRALVIGNDSYKTINKLENARADARAIAENLAAVGYQVTMRLDVTEKEMKAVLRNFSSQIEGGDEVFFFFAGHGVQLGAANYLLPTDIAGDNEAQVKDESIQLQRILDEMAERKAKFTLAMIDACRDNPFKSSGRAIGGRGLAPTTAATGQMIIFSAGSGQQALDKLGNDDREKNGLFTRVFIKEMQKSGQPVDRVVKNVRAQVVQLAKSVGHDQVPSIYDQVIGDFYFKK
ncbi:MAG: caspase family protein [Cytophagales bacterium]|nr:caspase family protein [Cytophagales bacterium]